MHVQEDLSIAATMANTQERAFVVIFGLPLFCAGERGTDLHVIVISEEIAPYMGKYI